jgi:lipopolysaccharide/colanic/teichoic acid biosynthesis glycosyltransferase
MPRRERGLWRRIVPLLLGVDLLAIAGGLLGATQLRFLSATVDGLASPQPSVPMSSVALLAGLVLASVVSFRLYQRQMCVAGVEEYRRVVGSTSTAAFASLLVSFALVTPLSRGFLVLAWATTTVALCLGRFCVRRYVYALARRGRRIDRVLIVGASRSGLALASRLQASPSASAEVVGFLDEYRPVGYPIGEAFQVLGEPLDLWTIAARHQVTTAILIQSAMTWESLQALIPRLQRPGSVSVWFAPNLHDLSAQRLDVRQLGPIVLAAPRAQPTSTFTAAQKRLLDLVLAATALAIGLPVMILACAWLRLRTGQWPLSRRLVVGRGGEPFSLIEFRGSEWLRRAHLARIPSLVAVLSGRLSIIGPRPLTREDIGSYQQWAEFLLSVRPGFIGPWWESIPVAPDEEIELDVRYLRTYSAWSDFQVLWHAAGRLTRRERQTVGTSG